MINGNGFLLLLEDIGERDAWFSIRVGDHLVEPLLALFGKHSSRFSFSDNSRLFFLLHLLSFRWGVTVDPAQATMVGCGVVVAVVAQGNAPTNQGGAGFCVRRHFRFCLV